MRIRTLADRLGTTPHAIRFYERRGFLPRPPRGENRYREYAESDVDRLRLLIGLRQLDLPLEQAAQLASMCAEGRCEKVSADLRAAIADKRTELRRRMREMRYLESRLAHLQGDLSAGEAPRSLITFGKEEGHDVM
ncbi:MAG: MerR family transcriptional regulator [Chloroflexi bacterium]|nr:MerR family transcriptional regulator [Chloroflexota bacterium]